MILPSSSPRYEVLMGHQVEHEESKAARDEIEDLERKLVHARARLSTACGKRSTPPLQVIEDNGR
jgi:hypothetical protein